MRIHDLLDEKAVELSFTPINKEAAISHLVEIIAKTGCLSDQERFKAAVFDREAKGSTGLGEGIAIPHAKSAGCVRPGLAAMVVKEGVDFESIDGKPVKLIFLIASPRQASDAHLDVLARLSTLLIDEKFRQDLMSCETVEQFLSLIDKAEGEDLAQQEDEQKQHAQENYSDKAQDESY